MVSATSSPLRPSNGSGHQAGSPRKPRSAGSVEEELLGFGDQLEEQVGDGGDGDTEHRPEDEHAT